MKKLGWEKAIIKVLKDAENAMHYTDITEAILTQQLRGEKVGATPSASVSSYITTSINTKGVKSPFIRVGRGEYILRDEAIPAKEAEKKKKKIIEEEKEETLGIVNAFGMFWQRDLVDWKGKGDPKILGRQQIQAESVNFCDQQGVYLLHDNRDVVYVGRAAERPLGKRLYEHTLDRLNGRWNRFSWFGLKAVTEKGALVENSGNPSINQWISTMEALLIEGLEPPQNRRRGDDFSAVEYLQAEDPDLQERQRNDAIRQWLDKK